MLVERNPVNRPVKRLGKVKMGLKKQIKRAGALGPVDRN